ncbi:putative calcium-binding protein CML19 [Rhodamnia argentea]|uniref:Calcium-binding protein CML19 n=1 Tax=Rhodamnia argentea TaxID=178133 RepID=A0A8B8P1M9_9MYRT|nr:putative calcium-binding protein CML19 [Rhodamnia argentea]
MKFDLSVRSGSSTSSSPERDPGTKRESAFGRLRRKLSPRRSADRRPPSADDAGGYDCGKSGELRRVFDFFDENGDGRISPAELRSCVRSLGGDLSSEEAEMAVRASDLDGDGMLGFEEFESLVEGGGEEERRKDLEDAFGMYDMDGSGCITASGLKRMLSRLGETRSVEDCKAMIRAFDLNGDGVLSFDEFRVMMR